MKVSIIIPIYNVAPYLEQCVESVASQTYGDFEVLFVDDCSTDFSMSVLKACIEHSGMPDDKVRIIHHEQNKGLSAARNTGIRQSRGEYVYFLDSDDWISADCIEKMVKCAEGKKHVDMVIGNYEFVGPNIGCPRMDVVGKTYLNRSQHIKEYCKEHIYPMAWNRMVRRQLILDEGLFFDEGLIHEDTIWNFRMLAYAKKVGCVADSVYFYRIRQNSIQTSTSFRRHFNAKLQIAGMMTDFAYKHKLCMFYNFYVYNFLEEEKLRYLYDCIHANDMDAAAELYDVIRSHPHLPYWLAKAWAAIRFFPRVKRRDKHYRMPKAKGLDYFRRLPEIV